MYWSESWKEASAQRPPANGGGPPAKAGGGDLLLDKIISEKVDTASGERVVRVEFPTPAFETRFKSCLSQVPVEARIEGEGRGRALLLRPRNIRYFDDLVRSSGLINCEAAMRAVNFLKTHATGFLRFETR
ncbi:MAG: hypothetical protein QUS14_14175 [Pyrinomonadaceae bacterium]|nr:hypothetical protein [Pyrinomonadaceae bacterium]